MQWYSKSQASVIAMLVFSGCSQFSFADGQAPKLVLQITVDGLRGDLLQRYQHNFGEGGFRHLLDNGVVYTNAQYQHANTETIVGHATLATGSHPAVHGLVGNVWLDSDDGELAYNIEDSDYPLLATRDSVSKGEQLDPAQKKSRTQGRSPVAMLVPTFADVLAAAGAGKTRVFGISGKDRGAVAMAGHAGKAFWYSTDSGDFQTSSYYYDVYPEWVTDWNNQRRAEALAGQQWELLQPQERYVLGHQDDRPYEVDLKGYGRVFPHPFGPADHPLFATRLLVSPQGDKLLMDFARTLIDAERLGRHDGTDFLAVSFSSVDAVNHFFGPSSLENEDVVLQLDRTLAGLLLHVDNTVGLDKSLIVLAADHGMAEMPEYMRELGYPAGRMYSEDVIATANALGKELFGIDEICKTFFRPSLYLNKPAIAAARLDLPSVANELAAALSRVQGIGLAKSKAELLSREHSGIAGQMQRNTHPERSGDIYIAQAPYWFMFDKGAVAAMHGSPWRYDTHVPIIFAGPTISGQKISRLVHPVDVAPTMAALLGIPSPAAAQGSVLTEVLQ
jgi:predicted AlkP superfamily pyrophosphatase or phosphodiesterase